MKKLSIFVLALVFLFGSTSSAAAQAPINGVVPAMGHASGTMVVAWHYDYWNIDCVNHYTVTLDFWNIGAYGPNQEAISNYWIQDDGTAGLTCNQYGLGGSTNFSGGPNGVFDGSAFQSIFYGRMVNGRTIEATIKGEIFNGGTDVTLTVADPTIFDGWTLLAPTGTPLPANLPPLEDSQARFSDLSGKVEINVPEPDGTYHEETWNYAELNQVLPVGTHIRTGDSSNSTVILSFADMTTFVLKPGTEIILSSPAGHDSQIKILAGNLWANVKKMAKDGSMTVEMSQAVAGIKGTTFIVEETGTTSTLKVIEGTVAYTSNVDETSVQVGTGQQATATSAGMGTVSSFDVNAYQDYGSISPTTSSVPSDPGIKPINLLIFLAGVSFCLIATAAIALAIVLLIKKNARRA